MRVSVDGRPSGHSVAKANVGFPTEAANGSSLRLSLSGDSRLSEWAQLAVVWPMEDSTVSKDIRLLVLVKGDERYVFTLDDDNRLEALRQAARYAANPELSFTWYDAAVMSQKIRQTTFAAKREAAAEDAFQPFDFDSRFRASMPSEDPADWLDEEEAL